MEPTPPGLLLGLAAGTATTAGGLALLLKPRWRPQERLRLLGATGGMMAASVLLAFALPALEIAGPVPLLAGGLAGWFLVAKMARGIGGGAPAAVTMGIHNIPEGLALGVAPAIGEATAGLLLAGIALHNLPEGLAGAAAALAAGVAAPAAIGLAALSALGEPAGALIGAAAAAWSTAALPWALSIAAGAMARTVLEIWPRPTPRDVAPAGAAGAAGYAGLWSMLAA
jgi:ZIP family zinc transporter